MDGAADPGSSDIERTAWEGLTGQNDKIFVKFNISVFWALGYYMIGQLYHEAVIYDLLFIGLIYIESMGYCIQVYGV